MKVFLQLITLLFISTFFISCHSFSSDELSRTFDIPLVNKSEALLKSGNNKALIMLNKEYLQTARKKDYKEGEALCYIYIASAYAQVGNSENAKNMLNRAKILLTNSDNAIIKSVFYHHDGKLSTTLDLYSRGLDQNRKAIYYSEKVKNDSMKTFLLGRTYHTRGHLLELVNNYDSSLIFYHKAAKINPTASISTYIAQFHLLYTKEIDSSYMYITKALKITQQTKKNDIDTVFTYIIAADYYREINQFEQAEQYLNKALEVLNKMGNSQHIMYAYLYNDWMILAEKMKNQKKTDYYYTKLNQAKDNFEKQRPGIANMINEQFISETKKNEPTPQIHSFFYIVLLFILFFAFCVYMYIKIKILKESKIRLKNETEMLRKQFYDKRYDELIELAKKNDSSFYIKFKNTYPDFINNLLAICPDLENSELVFCAMLKLNFTSKEIATYLFILPKSVQQRKRRIRKRLNISSDQDIYEFINNLA